MCWSDENSPAELEQFLEAGLVAQAQGLIRIFLDDVTSTGRAVPKHVAKTVTGTLRDYTLFEELEEVAHCILAYDADNPRAQIQYAQALIERKRMTSAIEVLVEWREKLEQWKESEDRGLKTKAADEWPEVVGLLGRSYKQLYIDAQPNTSELREHDLDCAKQFYREAYGAKPGTNYWHGINWVALLTNAERVRTGNRRALNGEAKEIAGELLEFLADDQSYWGIATRLEAHLATGDTRAAIDACKQCLDDPTITRFSLRGTIRELEEVWLLDEDSPPGNQILTPMKIRMAQLPGGGMLLDPRRDVIDRDELQRVWGDASYRPVEWLENALARAKAVARVGVNVHAGHGTGFLVDGAGFSGADSGRNLLLTNAHVCSPDQEVRDMYGALSPESAVVSFLASDDRQAIRGKPVFSSPPTKLDATLLELERVPAGITRPKLAPLPGDGFPVRAGERVSIIGHPHGGGMQVSIQDNKTKEVGDPCFWYQTPTDPGSSGSPIFDREWRLVGLHHSSRSDKQANEGVRIDRILEAVRELASLDSNTT